ncbi:MAG: aldehyde dehydrogenase family protein [Myxococcota bacterium]
MTTTEYPSLIGSLRSAFESGKTRPLAWRRSQLQALIALCNERESELAQAIYEDFKKPELEAVVTDVRVNIAEAEFALRHLEDWVRPTRASAPLALQPASGEVRSEPFGVALILSPWNYPVQLALQPLVAALAAGNCAVVKPSELTPATSAALARLLPSYLDTDCVAVVEGGVPETTALLEQRFDKIFYTGNGAVARIVMAAAAKHLTPVSLELGGKSPVILDGTLNMRLAARRLVWGRFLNAGQTCVAPDYVLVAREHKSALIDALRETIREFYGADPKQSRDFARIVNDRHFTRLAGLLEGHDPAVGGERDADERYIAPTVLDDPSPDSPVMREEIFGPVLPVLAYDSLDEAIRFVNDRDAPLALYVFSKKRSVQQQVIDGTRSGGAVINDTTVHLGCLDLPFGGAGESGMGAYHGHFGFEAFSRKRAVLDRATFVDPPLRYPPYSPTKLKWLKRLL